MRPGAAAVTLATLVTLVSACTAARGPVRGTVDGQAARDPARGAVDAAPARDPDRDPVDAAPRLTIEPAVVEPGGVALVRVDGARIAAAELRVRFRGHESPCFAGADGRARALLGIDLATPPGRYAVEASTAAAGRDARALAPLTAILTVRAKEFPREELTVAPRYVTPDRATLARIRHERERLEATLARVSRERLWGGRFELPADGPLGSPFGVRRFFNGEERSPHGGQDVRVPVGTPVRAAAAGRAVLVAPLYFSGNTVVLDHGLGLFTLYFHLSAFRVREGAIAEAGAPLGTSGATGRATGPHLHWAARLAGARIDPLLLLGAPVTEESDGRKR